MNINTINLNFWYSIFSGLIILEASYAVLLRSPCNIVLEFNSFKFEIGVNNLLPSTLLNSLGISRILFDEAHKCH